tara:strand:- start:1286 stop:3922 length:2637 start_codon:yes stop_codon:yes gene_type:complete
MFRNNKKPELGEVQKIFNYGIKYDEKYEMSLIDEHYFILDKNIELTPYAIRNYNEIKNIDRFYLINEVLYKNNKPRYVRRFNLGFKSNDIINRLLENKESVLIKYSKIDLMKTPFSDLNIGIDNLNYGSDEYRKIRNNKEIEEEEKKEFDILMKSYKEYLEFIKEDPKNKHLKFELKMIKDGLKPLLNKIEYKEKQKKRPTIYFDFETYEKYDEIKKSKIHTPFLCRSETVYPDGKIKKNAFYGSNCAYNFLKSIEEDSLCVAHNLGFDFRFILSKLYKIKNYIDKGNNIFNAKGQMYIKEKKKLIDLEFKDSYQLIPKPLSDFGNCFKLTTEKEIMPYGAYNYKTINKKHISIKYAKKFLKEEDYEQFEKNIDKWNLRIEDKYFNHLGYSDLYCAIDVEVLRKGYTTFREWMKEVCNIDINNKITICSLAHEYLINEGCYKDVLEISGTPREFIQKCVVGGRCMTNDNKKYHCKVKLQDFDAVSLYPSAMSEMKGFLKGKPKIIENTDYYYLKENSDGFFCEVKINNIPKKRDFSLISELNEEGSRIFKNEINENLYLDNITIEDLIEFQELVPNKDFEIIRGYYFNKGFNTKIKEVIQHLFNERKKKKSEGNPIQEVYKLIMNSAYGKTIQKPVNKKKIFCDKKNLLENLSKNPSYISSYTKIYNENPKYNKYVIESYNNIHEHFSIPHVGVQILSQSKRIMNRVMCLAEDLDLKIYYQDTDSMHIKEDDIPELSKAFKEKYNKDLIGKELGQFHSDFNDEIYINGEKKHASHVVSIESYFLGKKCYIDKLEKTYNGEKYYDYHIRMKGVPSSSIKLHELDNMEIYNELSKDKTIKFNLLADPFKVRMEFNNDFTINNRKSFYREVQFKGKLYDVN